jgi:hypothetical protein
MSESEPCVMSLQNTQSPPPDVLPTPSALSPVVQGSEEKLTMPPLQLLQSRGARRWRVGGDGQGARWGTALELECLMMGVIHGQRHGSGLWRSEARDRVVVLGARLGGGRRHGAMRRWGATAMGHNSDAIISRQDGARERIRSGHLSDLVWCDR